MASTFFSTALVFGQTWAEAIFLLKEQLKAAGWTVPSSSDGTTYNPAGDQITSGGSGAGGLDNASAWFRIQQPAGGVAPYSGTREWLFQHSDNPANSTDWVSAYDFAGFTGGAPDAVTSPTGADTNAMLGNPGGNGASAVGLFSGVVPTIQRIRLQIIALDDTKGFSFWFASKEMGNAGPYVDTVIYFDAMVSGSFPYGTVGAQDNDPYVMQTKFTSTFPVTDTGGNPENFMVYGSAKGNPIQSYKHGLAGAAYASVGALKLYDGGNTTLPVDQLFVGYPFNRFNYKIDTIPVEWGVDRSQANPGWKGISTLFEFTMSHSLGCVVAFNQLGDAVLIYQSINGTGLVLPWDATVPLD